MPNFYNSLLFVHVLIGAASLVLFWVPVATRKGSLWHRRAGRWYANAMYAVSISAFVMSTMMLIDPVGSREPGNDFTMGSQHQVDLGPQAVAPRQSRRDARAEVYGLHPLG